MGDTVPDDSDPFSLDGGDRSRLVRARDWILLDGDRVFIAFAVSLSVFVLFFSLERVGVIAFVNDDSVTRLAGGMIAGTFSLVTLVVSINQMILSQEFTTATQSQDRLDGIMEFRREIESEANVPATPASPSKILELISETANDRAERVAESVTDIGDEELRELVTGYADSVIESTNHVDDALEEATFGTFGALSVAIQYNEAWHLYLARHIRNRHEDELPAETVEALDELVDVLRRFNIAREHFKTTYLQRELTQFSRFTVYLGVPSILSAMLIGFAYAGFGGPTLTLQYLPVVVCALLAVIVSPLALLVSYILRTATVTRRTASIGPMIPEKEPEAGPLESVTNERED